LDGKVSNAGDRMAIGCAGNDNRAVRSGVAGDGDHAVVGRKSELRSRNGGQQHRNLQADVNQVLSVVHFLIFFSDSSFQS
jgi:hypothetical protein